FFFRDRFATVASSAGPDDIVTATRAGVRPTCPARGLMNSPRTDVRSSAMAEEIRAEMVANVWKVVASPGDQVSDGDTLVILESMKMEIPVLAEFDGVVKEI